MAVSAPPIFQQSELLILGASFSRSPRAVNRAETTVTIYIKAIPYLDAYLAAQGMPRTL